MFFLCLLVAGEALACPAIQGLRDVNCDGKLKISVIGDSIGRGSRGNLRVKGSFVKRIRKKIRFATFKNLSIPGLDTKKALKYLRKNFPKTNEYEVKKSLLDNSDFVLIQLGINDYFSTNDPQVVIERHKLIMAQINSYLAEHGGVPVIAIALITPVKPISENRALQATFIKSLNEAMIAAQSPEYPAYVEFNSLTEEDIFRDGIHPTTEAHDKLTKILNDYIRLTLASVE